MLHFLSDPVILSRIQFAFTIGFHIIFPAFTIGLASFLVVISALRIKTKQPIYEEIYNLWVKIFALSFGMGVVSGIVLSYQFGTNWSEFSHKVGNVVGPVIGYEVLTAFYLEASFLGIMLFGRKRVSPTMHFIATCIVAAGTLLSAFWILSAASWMQTPAGYSIGSDGVFVPENWLEILFNPSFPWRFIHMVLACYLTTAFVIGGTSAWYLLKHKHVKHAKIMFIMSMMMALVVAPLQIFFGDQHGLNTLKHQPIKVAAMEGAWDTETHAPFRIFAIPNQSKMKNNYSIKIPYASSLVLTHSLSGEVKGLKDWPKAEHPNVPLVFYSFRVMIAIGLLMAFVGVVALILFFKNKLFTTPWFLRLCIVLTPSGFIALLAGWVVTEAGRQPYLVYGLLKTADLVSPVPAHHILLSLISFVIVYFFVFSMGTYYMFNLVRKGPSALDENLETELGVGHSVLKPLSVRDIFHLK